MTRINVIDPQELVGKHLVAEYRELPRVFGSVRRFINRPEYVDSRAAHRDLRRRQPAEYVLGTGHVIFFYDKLLWLSRRHVQLVEEMVRRGYNPNFRENLRVAHSDIKGSWWWNDYEPTEEAREVNRSRIRERLS